MNFRQLLQLCILIAVDVAAQLGLGLYNPYGMGLGGGYGMGYPGMGMGYGMGYGSGYPYGMYDWRCRNLLGLNYGYQYNPLFSGIGRK
ncbi:unnamed protein product [Cylicocyclus nassatus]|uniref:Uncharacterized protein n=1 Tax=Cylicocyclus nassatus TaxID=53992 RepID=A0AA36GKB6_CYLNA|nr:unnamed protein product [Cylicocyclus nassatus]